MSQSRPDPDALLAVAAREGRGRLKVFLGAAPGVGKTYAMLEEARRRQAGGTDVLAGLIETHGRAETEAQLGTLPVLPRTTPGDPRLAGIRPRRRARPPPRGAAAGRAGP